MRKQLSRFIIKYRVNINGSRFTKVLKALSLVKPDRTDCIGLVKAKHYNDSVNKVIIVSCLKE